MTHLEDTRYKGKKRVVQTEQNQQVANGAWKFFSWPWQGWFVHKHHIHLFKVKIDILLFKISDSCLLPKVFNPIKLLSKICR